MTTQVATTAVHWHEAIVCVPAIVVLLGLGIRSGEATQGAIAAGAALSVGFGATRELRGRRWGAMLAATLAMAAAAFVGSLAGQDPVLHIAIAAIAAAACATLALRDEDLWWVVLQAVIALLVAGAYAGSLGAATERASAVVVGGAVQMAFVLVLSIWLPHPPSPAAEPKPVVPRAMLVAHGLRAMVAVIASMAIAQALGLANGYWAPMTVLLVLKPGLHDTRERGLQRVGGTVAGCAAATLIAFVVHGVPAALLVVFVVAACFTFALQKATYAVFSAALTATVVLLITLGNRSVVADAEHRILATLLGGAIALAGAWVGPKDMKRVAASDRVGGP